MKSVRWLAIIVLVVTVGAALCANYLAPAGYEHQFRESPGASPSAQHLLGTDDLGRDRFARLLYGARVSLVLAPLAAAIYTMLAAFWGGLVISLTSMILNSFTGTGNSRQPHTMC